MESPQRVSYANIAKRTSQSKGARPPNRFSVTPAPLQPLQASTEKVKQEPKVEDKSEDNKENVKHLDVEDRSVKMNSAEDDEKERENAGLFGLLSSEALVAIAVHLGPQSVCSLGRTCRFLLRQLLNEKVWKLVSNPTSKPQITFRLESSMKKIDPKKDGDKKDGVKKDGDKKEEIPLPPDPRDIRNLLVDDYKNEASRKRLADHWMLLSLVSQAERDSKSDANKKKDKLPLKLGGGIYIDASFSFGNKKNDRPPVRVLATKDLSMIPVWMNGVIELLRGKTKVSLPYSNGTVQLQRVGRGGSVLKFVIDEKDLNEMKTFYFNLSKFCIEFRNAAKEYRALVASCLKYYIKYSGRDVELESDESESKAIVKNYKDRENAIKEILSPSLLDAGVKNIKNLLKSGVSGVSLAAYFKEKKEEKQRVNAQRALEYSNMYKFLVENLPRDYDEVKVNAEQQNVDVSKRKLVDQADKQLRKDQFEQQRANQQKEAKKAPRPERPTVMKILGTNLAAAKEKEEEELKELLKDPAQLIEYKKKRAEESKLKAEAKAEEEKKKAEKRVKKVVERVVDEHGFITEQTRFVRAKEVDNVVEEPLKGGKKQQGKKQQQNKKNNKQQKKVNVSQNFADDESYLSSNPYAAALQQEEYESISETLYKKVMKNQSEASPKVKAQQKGKYVQSQKKKVGNKPKNNTNKSLAKNKPKGGKNQQRRGLVATTNTLGFMESHPQVFQLVIGLLLLIFVLFVYSFVISGISTS